MRELGKALFRWVSLWLVGGCILGIPARFVAGAVTGLLSLVAESLLVGGLGLAPGPGVRLLLGSLEDLLTLAVMLAIAWGWSRSAVPFLFRQEARDLSRSETLGSRTVELDPSPAMVRRVATLGVVPVALPLLVQAAFAGIDVTSVFSLGFLLLTGLPALVAVRLVWRLRRPRLVQTPTHLTWTRPLLPELRLPLSVVEHIDVDDDGLVRLRLEGRERVLGGVHEEIPEGLPRLLGEVEARVEERAQTEVDPELRVLRGRGKESS